MEPLAPEAPPGQLRDQLRSSFRRVREHDEFVSVLQALERRGHAVEQRLAVVQDAVLVEDDRVVAVERQFLQAVYYSRNACSPQY